MPGCASLTGLSRGTRGTPHPTVFPPMSGPASIHLRRCDHRLASADDESLHDQISERILEGNALAAVSREGVITGKGKIRGNLYSTSEPRSPDWLENARWGNHKHTLDRGVGSHWVLM